MFREKLLNFLVVAYWTIAVVGSIMFALFFPAQFLTFILVFILITLISG